MDSLITFVGDGYVMSASDETSAQQVIRMKDDHDKIMELDSHKLLAAGGPPGDVSQFTEYIQKNVHLYNLRVGVPISTEAVANYTRKELAEFLRKAPYQCNIILAGYDKGVGKDGNGEASCYFLDYLGTLHKMNFIADGYAQYFTLATMDRHWRKGLSFEEGLELMKKCIDAVKERLILVSAEFVVKIVDKDGCRRLGVEELKKAGIETKLQRAPQFLAAIKEAELQKAATETASS